MQLVRIFLLAATAVFASMTFVLAQDATNSVEAGLRGVLDGLAGTGSALPEAGARAEEFLPSVQRAVQTGDWERLGRLAADAPPSAPRPLCDVLLGFAEIRSGRSGPGKLSMRKGLTAAAANGRLAALADFADRLGAKRETDAALIALCGQPDEAGPAFAAVRLRVADPSEVAVAYDAARRAAPEAPSVRDHARYLALLDGRAVDRAEVEAAVAAAPQDPLPRITLLLACLRSDEPATALAALDDVVVVFNAMPPGLQALISAAYAAAGQTDRALRMASTIDTSLLRPGEYAVIAPLRAAQAGKDFGSAGSWRSIPGRAP